MNDGKTDFFKYHEKQPLFLTKPYIEYIQLDKPQQMQQNQNPKRDDMRERDREGSELGNRDMLGTVHAIHCRQH